MKKVIYLMSFLLVSGSVALTSCKDFLDKEPLGQPSLEVILADESNIDFFLNRIYASLSWREWFIGRQLFNLWEFGADDLTGNPGSGQYNNFKNFAYNASEQPINEFWNRTYDCLNHCNQVISRTGGFTDRAIAVSAEAQARLFRAYHNFGLVRVFGEAPLRDHLPTSADEFDIPKSSADQIYASIIADLEYAIENLPTRAEWGTDGLGRVTRGTAQGLLAKVYLQRQDNTNAQKWAHAVITGGEYSLDPSYRDLFSPDNLYSVENMMPGHYKHVETVPDGRKWNPYIQFQGIGNGVGNGELAVDQSIVDAYEEGDPRFAASVFDSQTDQIFDTNGTLVTPLERIRWANKKVIWPATYWNSNQFSWMNLNPLFLRYADIVLIYAEATNELGTPLGGLTAEAALEQVRFRARGNQTFAQAGVLPEITGLGKEAMREAIWHERRIELSFEFQRWNDLIRYEKVVPGYMTNLLRNTYGRTNFDYARNGTYPIPQEKINSSQGILLQNDAWR
jgi:hypothetical protein